MMKFLRTIRFDTSDDNVFDTASGGGEWSVSGAFAFVNLDRDDIVGKTKQAFANGFLGLGSFGRSTFAVVTEITQDERDTVEGMLAEHFVDAYGAPDLASALPVAREECSFVSDLCADTPINTVFTVRRTLDDDDQINEEFRTMQAPTGEAQHARIWTMVDEDD